MKYRAIEVFHPFALYFLLMSFGRNKKEDVGENNHKRFKKTE